MSAQKASEECVIDGQLKCVEKRDLTKRGVRFSRIKLRSSGGSPINFTVAALQATLVEIGKYYKIAILPDRAPDAPTSPKLNPGDSCCSMVQVGWPESMATGSPDRGHSEPGQEFGIGRAAT